MPDSSDRVGKVLRFVASGGMAGEDADIVAGLLTQAHRMADLVIADTTSAPELRTLAADFLDRLNADTFDRH